MFRRLGPIILAFVPGVVALRAAEPANLETHKEELRAYVKSGEYARDIATVAADARAWIEQRAKQGGTQLTLVCDLDETLLSNWPEMVTDDFGGNAKSWEAWMEASDAPAIEPVKELFLAARTVGIEVVFLTARNEAEREATERNLRKIGCGDYARLICLPAGTKETAAEFKTAQRRKLAAEGRTIVANIGDQASDLSGGYAERTFKLPNPFYLVK